MLNIDNYFSSRSVLSIFSVKGELSGLRQFMAIESPLKMGKNNAFYFTSEFFFVLKIFQYLPSIFDNVAKQHD